MTLREYVKQLIMQYPSIFHNALLVYDHLFYVIGNAHEWHNGTLIPEDFKEKSIAECIAQSVQQNYELTKNTFFNRCETIKPELAKKLRSNAYTNYVNDFVEDIHTILNADKLADDFSIPKRWPYNIKPFQFYPICKYAKCMNIPDDIDPEWLDAINKLNKIKKEYEANGQNKHNGRNEFIL